jgi:hypothetical protein
MQATAGSEHGSEPEPEPEPEQESGAEHEEIDLGAPATGDDHTAAAAEPLARSTVESADHQREERARRLEGVGVAAATHPGSASPNAGLSRDEMLAMTAQLIERTGGDLSEEAALELLIPSRWSLEDALDLWEEQEKERRYRQDKLGLGSVGASLWSWGTKAAASVTEVTKAASELSKDVVTKAKEAGSGVSKVDFASSASASLGALGGQVNDLVDGVFPMDGGSSSSSSLRNEVNEAVERESRFHEQFPALKQENVIDAFECTLLQKYRCHLNALTPELPGMDALLPAFSRDEGQWSSELFLSKCTLFAVGFGGTLYVTSLYACFYLDATLHQERHQIPLTMPFANVKAVNAAKKAKDMVRVVVGDSQLPKAPPAQYIFTEFDEGKFEEALGILEQMWEDAGGSGQ